MKSDITIAAQRHNFDKITNSINLGVGYDYNSIMHYPDWAFSTNGKPTIEAVGNAIGAEIGQRDGMTAGDIEQVNKFYECDKSSGSSSGFGGQFTQILKRGMSDKGDGKRSNGTRGSNGSNDSNGTSGSNGSSSNKGSKESEEDKQNNEDNENNGDNGNNQNSESNGNNGSNGNSEGNGSSENSGNGGEKKPQDKKGGKCEAQFNKEQANKARKMARKEELMRQQYENIKRREEEERLSAMLKRRRKH